MDLETRKPPMTMRELMKKKRGVKGKSLMVDKSRSAPERSPFVQDEVTDHFRSEAEATAGDSDTGRKGVKKRLLREKKEANASKQRTKHLVSLFLVPN